MAYNNQVTRNVIKINMRVLEVSKKLASKDIEHEIKNTTIIIDGVKYQGHRQLGLLEQLY